MKKLSLAMAIFASFSLVGCANTDVYSGDVYTAEQAKSAQSVTLGTILSVRPVTIQAEGSNGVLGSVGGGIIGGIAGSHVGGGKGQAIATAVGAIAGAMAGSTVEQKMNQTSALELMIRKDDGQEIVVVQKGDNQFSVGRRVRITGTKSNLSVSLL